MLCDVPSQCSQSVLTVCRRGRTRRSLCIAVNHSFNIMPHYWLILATGVWLLLGS